MPWTLKCERPGFPSCSFAPHPPAALLVFLVVLPPRGSPFGEAYASEEDAMPEHRARKHHQDRVAETLKEEIGAMIEGELTL